MGFEEECRDGFPEAVQLVHVGCLSAGGERAGGRRRCESHTRPVVGAGAGRKTRSGNLNSIRVQEFTFRLPFEPRRGPVPAGKPSWVQIGPYEAVAIDRQGDAVTATFDIPADASVGMLLDGHIEFTPAVTGRPVVVFKRNDVMRVAE